MEIFENIGYLDHHGARFLLVVSPASFLYLFGKGAARNKILDKIGVIVLYKVGVQLWYARMLDVEQDLGFAFE